MKVRVGLGLGVGRLVEGRRDLIEIVDSLEELDFDSLWTSEVFGSHAPDAVTALAFAAARTSRLKLGTSVVAVPGRNPVALAKQFATLDIVSNGRFFPVVGLGTPDADAVAAQGVARAERGPITDEMLPLLRRLWREDLVTHNGSYFTLSDYRPHIHPVRRSLSMWLGGRARSELQRAGRLGDGWLASFATPAEIADSIQIVRDAATAADRRIPDDHFGVLLPYTAAGPDDEMRAFASWRRPGVAPDEFFPGGPDQLNGLLSRYVEAGATKFVIVPWRRPQSWPRMLRELRDSVAYVRGTEIEVEDVNSCPTR
ncbi:LLM class flavin-dependent oxidoreductase [Nocardia salmonicida]|uniref:LLM class flavin-dependent oxidoreductase n=1 Tax=Nocardia salmonicida TaxID=53431 RepID=UPI003CED1DFB